MTGQPTDALRAVAGIAEEVTTQRYGPSRVMELQRARMWDRNPSEWTRYERLMAEAIVAALAAAQTEKTP